MGNTDTYDTSSDEGCFMHHLKIHHTSKQQSLNKMCCIKINGIQMGAQPDSGSDTNIMGERQYKLLKEKPPEMQINRSKV